MGQQWEATGRTETWRDALMGRVARLARQRLTERRAVLRSLVVGNGRDGDEVTARTERDELEVADMREKVRVLEALQVLERQELREIDAALERLEQETWGSCERCEGPIGLQRLNALPEARRCIRCMATAVES